MAVGSMPDPRKNFIESAGLGQHMKKPAMTEYLQNKRLGGTTLPSLEQTDSGAGSSSSGNTKYVDDKGWGVSLSQILGSKMLSPEQLQRASIQNVASMFKVNGGTTEEKEEMYFMFQRMMLEGMVRGVDITKDMSRQKKFEINFVPTVPNASSSSVIGNSTQSGVNIKQGYWRGKDDAAKLSLFYHEVGHELMNKGHEGSGMMKSGGGMTTSRTIKSTRDSYDKYMNEFYDSSNSRGFEHLKVGTQKHEKAEYDPSWFPSAQGGEDKGGYSPGSAGSNYANAYDNSTTNNTTNNYGTIGQFSTSTADPITASADGGASAKTGNAQATAGASGYEDMGESSFSRTLQSMAQTGDAGLQNAGNITNKA